MEEHPIIGTGDCQYRWNGRWAQLPDSIHGEPLSLGFTHGVQVVGDGSVYVFNQSRHGVLRFEPDGRFAGAWPEFPSDRFLGAHGMTLMSEGGEEFFWLTDQRSGEVVKTTLAGETVLSLDRPGGYGAEEKYSPTWAVQADAAHGGRVYVGDGYGSSRVSVYDADGRFVDMFDGVRGAGAFKCPHGLMIAARPAATGHADPLVYVTDRGNSRVQVFDLAGGFVKSFEQEHPCCFDVHAGSGRLLVPDLFASISLYDEKDELLAVLGSNRDIVGSEGWPNVPHERRLPGHFNSPHGGCFDAAGNIYIVEWIRDGRITRLEKQ